jgi:hypothetical protein
VERHIERLKKSKITPMDMKEYLRRLDEMTYAIVLKIAHQTVAIYIHVVHHCISAACEFYVCEIRTCCR